MASQPKPLRLQWQGAAACERIVECGEQIRIEKLCGLWVSSVQLTCLTPTFLYLGMSLC